MSSTPGRLIPLQSCAGAENMAIDQTLLESVDSSGDPVLRFYAWQQPTLSLGYFQKAAHRSEHAESRTNDCVRRSTGGGAIVHHHELTYSIAVGNPSAAAGPRLDLYRRTHQCLVESLCEFGVIAVPFRTLTHLWPQEGRDPFLCFQRRTNEDLIVSGYKVVGSAQRRSRVAILQHGSVLLRASRCAPQLPGVEDLTSRSVPAGVLAELFAAKLGASLAIQWRPGQLTEAEKQRTAEVVQERFGTKGWTLRR